MALATQNKNIILTRTITEGHNPFRRHWMMKHQTGIGLSIPRAPTTQRHQNETVSSVIVKLLKLRLKTN